MRFALLLVCLAAPAHATCQGHQLFACQIGAKVLEICHYRTDLTYSFGPDGTPDLTITQPLEEIFFQPWPGVSSSIWESVIFTNQDHAYEVWTAQERSPESEGLLEGGVRVLNGEELLAELTCDPGTASQPLDGIWGLKESVGQCWDFEAGLWRDSCG